MGRMKSANPSKRVEIWLPGDLYSRVSSELWSDLEGKIPFGAWTRWLQTLADLHYNSVQIDASLYAPELPIGSLLSGDPATISALKRLLERTS